MNLLAYLSIFVSLSAYAAHSLPAQESDSPSTQAQCHAFPTSIRTIDDLKVKVKASPGTCSIHEGFFHIVPRATDEDYSCSQTKPCPNGACCAKTGFCNYGPDACGTNGQSPNDKCWSNCNATAPCGQYASPAGKTCPLNVCCSKFGFCGTTQDFCGDGCQSNCEQPTSGSQGGTSVQARVIGYYESWNSKSDCIGMSIADIPVAAITHLHFAFAYLAPDTYDVVPMPGVSGDLFSQITDLKKKNVDLKVLISIGGWTFNDNGTTTQPVFSDIVSSDGKMLQASVKIIQFLQQYGFDGVDFDWEYPGAPDRGGNPDRDGKGFTQFLKILQNGLQSWPNTYTVSFTAPTSYWYLQHFDLNNMMQYVDWANVMSYDLHGTWDATDPIGNHVLAHTNLTEIQDALDLFWRNGVDPFKLNLGLGFYGRSFTLADPSCYQPGCLFKAGGTPGVCTQNSGTLSYREIMQIIEQQGIKPYYDVDAAVKYITWNTDQWISYDDQDTFQQKIAYANKLGMGGLLIWALDLDTADLQALSGVLYPFKLDAFALGGEDPNNWQDAASGDCYVTDCFTTTCKPGTILVNGDQWCSDGNGNEGTNSLCCPIASAPDPSQCTWRGRANFDLCNGGCGPGEIALQSNRKGDGTWCTDGRQYYCCRIPNFGSYGCDVTQCGEPCPDGKTSLGSAPNDCFPGDVQQLCCNADAGFTNCGWVGEPGSCFDNHCNSEGHQVQLWGSWNGGGEDCGWVDGGSRTRALCCDRPHDKSPFLPVPLEYLFPDPPPLDTSHVDYNLKVDPTFGGTIDPGPDPNDPEAAEFGFFLLASPQEIQVSLDKRDGSHWEVFDCFDAISEKEQTVRMFCSNESPSSNCHKIHLGHGAPGTIVEMPKGCGPGKYAVVKTLAVSQDQSIPKHLAKRSANPAPAVYDLTFDYDFARVPRDMGTTQMRLDFSNEPGYWDKMVDKAGNHQKRKRDVEDFGGNHRRWLYDAWREDKHEESDLSHEDLHKRWFGSDVIDWLKGLLNGVSGQADKSYSNNYHDEFKVILADESYFCNIKGVDLEGRLNLAATLGIDIDTNFGLTIIATIGGPGESFVNLQDSYVYFRNAGSVSALFTLDAFASATFSSGDILLLSADRFGATFSVPGILTIGPNLKLYGSIDAGFTLGAHLESQVNLANWDVQQTYPVATDDWQPKALKTPNRDGTQELFSPTFNYSVSVDGYITGHIKPTVVMGLDFHTKWIPLDPVTIGLVADGSVTVYGNAQHSNSGQPSSACYGINAGADLYATVKAPDIFGWKLSVDRYQLAPSQQIQIVPEQCATFSKRDDGSIDLVGSNSSFLSPTTATRSVAILEPRGAVYGPLIRFSDLGIVATCPGDDDGSSIPLNFTCPTCDPPTTSGGSSQNALESRQADGGSCLFQPGKPLESRCPGDIQSRSLTGSQEEELYDNFTSILEPRTSKTIKWYTGNTNYDIDAGNYPSCSVAAQDSSVTRWYAYDPIGQCNVPLGKYVSSRLPGNLATSDFQTDHIFEVQTVRNFLLWLMGRSDPQAGVTIAWDPRYKQATDDWVTNYATGLGIGPNANSPWHDSNNEELWELLTQCLGGNNNGAGLALLQVSINRAKGNVFGLKQPVDALIYPSQQKTIAAWRPASAVFEYFRFTDPSGNQIIWSKFTAISKQMQSVFRTFDRTNDWTTRVNDQITPPSQQGGMERLWCLYMVKYLTAMEDIGKALQATMVQVFNQEYGGTTYSQSIIDGILGGQGVLAPSKFKFPRPLSDVCDPI